MFSTDEIEIWNLTTDGIARYGAVSIFNVVGRLKNPERIRAAHYSLNGESGVPIFFGRTPDELPLRLGRVGEFNIDTIRGASLRQHNVLQIRIVDLAGQSSTTEVAFEAEPFPESSPDFQLDLRSAKNAEDVGQVVEGPWRVSVGPGGDRYLEVRPDDTGYDRIILFGRQEWTTGYELSARFRVTALTGMHNIGLIFKWNPHKKGDGTYLPSQWSTGLGYYSSYGIPGLRIRFGVDVHRTKEGVKVGDYLLAHAHVGRGRYLLTKVLSRLVPSVHATELVVGQDYRARLRVHPDRYALTIWRPSDARGRPNVEPEPQVIVDHPTDLLPRGSVGLIAHQAGVQLHEFDVSPLCSAD